MPKLGLKLIGIAVAVTALTSIVLLTWYVWTCSGPNRLVLKAAALKDIPQTLGKDFPKTLGCAELWFNRYQTFLGNLLGGGLAVVAAFIAGYIAWRAAGPVREQLAVDRKAQSIQLFDAVLTRMREVAALRPHQQDLIKTLATIERSPPFAEEHFKIDVRIHQTPIETLREQVALLRRRVDDFTGGPNLNIMLHLTGGAAQDVMLAFDKARAVGRKWDRETIQKDRAAVRTIVPALNDPVLRATKVAHDQAVELGKAIDAEQASLDTALRRLDQSILS